MSVNTLFQYLFTIIVQVLVKQRIYKLAERAAIKVQKLKKELNKKVLLRECKRHTARREASVRYAAPSPTEGGGLPHPVLNGGYPTVPPKQTWDGVSPIQTWDVPPDQTWEWGTPCLDLGMGYPPSRPGMGYPPVQTSDGVPPHPNLGMGYSLPPPPIQTRDGVSPHPDLGWGTPPPNQQDGYPPRSMCGLTHKVKILPSSILWIPAVKKQLRMGGLLNLFTDTHMYIYLIQFELFSVQLFFCFSRFFFQDS